MAWQWQVPKSRINAGMLVPDTAVRLWAPRYHDLLLESVGLAGEHLVTGGTDPLRLRYGGGPHLWGCPVLDLRASGALPR
jgi:hypothetical protein